MGPPNAIESDHSDVGNPPESQIEAFGIRGEAAPKPEKAAKPRKPYVPSTKLSAPGAIDRMWAAHEKKTHKP